MAKRIYLLFIFSITLCAYSQSSQQHFKEAIIFSLKGHVKKCVVKSITETDDALFGQYMDCEDEYVYEFTPSGKYISDMKDRITRYDKDGKLIYQKYFVEGLLSNGVKEVSYKYNADNLLIEESGIEPFDEISQSFKNIYRFDENGFEKECREETETSTPTITTYLILSVDKRGNWIKRISKSSLGTTTETRTIYYYH